VTVVCLSDNPVAKWPAGCWLGRWHSIDNQPCWHLERGSRSSATMF
jgi:hypothetical protein